jgi:pimeloyl-ACP methyl ester carboxylesterase
MAARRLPDPVIVIPGITASYLADTYPLPPEVVWSVLTKEYERATLHPDDTRYEAKEPARVEPGQIYEIAYRELIDELRYNLAESPEAPVPVYPFAYDWRQPLDMIEARLAAFVDEVIGRTRVMRHYHRDGYAQSARVTLVGHSMGGLIIAGYLATQGAAAPVSKVVTLATPFQGSFEAIIKVATGTANLGTSAPSSREREASRVTPALYYLMPSFAEGVTIDPAFPQTLFDPGAWQPGIIDTIAQYVRLNGLDPANPDAQALRLFGRLLDAARQHRQRTDTLNLTGMGFESKRWLCVIGVDSTTRVAVEIVRRDGQPGFEFRTRDRLNEWGHADPAQRRKTGDGTVPFAGAVPRFLPYESLVCVSPDDFGYWELEDKGVARLAGFHGILPNMNMLHRLIVRHLTGRPDRHGNTWGRRAPGAARWDPPIADLEEET